MYCRVLRYKSYPAVCVHVHVCAAYIQQSVHALALLLGVVGSLCLCLRLRQVFDLSSLPSVQAGHSSLPHGMNTVTVARERGNTRSLLYCTVLSLLDSTCSRPNPSLIKLSFAETQVPYDLVVVGLLQKPSAA